ncbi:ParA family protein [Microbacterium kyungheense]|nr:ParA family protein [Microbacterium kyungheense]
MNKWLRRLGMGGRRDKVESDVERLAQGGEFHVKQPDETDSQASISSAEPPTASTPDAVEPVAEDSASPIDHASLDADNPVDSETAELDSDPGLESEPTAVAAFAEDQPTAPVGEEQAIAAADDTTAPEQTTTLPARADVASGEYAGQASDTQPESASDDADDAGAFDNAEALAQTDAAEPVAPTEPAEPEEAGVEREAAAEQAPALTQEEESAIAQEDPADVVQADDDSPIARELADLTARRKALEEAEVHLTGRTRVLTVSNQKGGVGKTTTTVNLAAALAERGARVLVIDLDPQGNASTALGVPHTSDIPSVYDVLIDEFPLADIIQVSPESPNLLCAPSTIHLAGAEIELVSQVAREHRLRVAVDDYLEKNPELLDFILIDCPPSLGLLTINAFTAAGELLIPIQCEYYALEGLSQLLGTVQMIQKHLNPRLQLSTILLTMYDGRTRLAQQVADEVRAHFPQQVLDTIIPRSVRVSEAPSFGQSVLAYDGQSAGAIAYREAAVEMIRRDSASNERGA